MSRNTSGDVLRDITCINTHQIKFKTPRYSSEGNLRQIGVGAYYCIVFWYNSIVFRSYSIVFRYHFIVFRYYSMFWNYSIVFLYYSMFWNYYIVFRYDSTGTILWWQSVFIMEDLPVTVAGKIGDETRPNYPFRRLSHCLSFFSRSSKHYSYCY